MNTITVKNTVNGYSGNTKPFTFTATVTDGGENQDDYDLNEFTDGEMTFNLTTGQTKILTVPYGATLTVTEGFVVGYDTTVKRGNKTAVRALSDSFAVAENLTLAFTNAQLIGMQLKNNTSSELTVMVSINTEYSPYKIYRVNEDMSGQEIVSETGAVELRIDAGKTALLEIDHKIDVKYERAYTVKGSMPVEGYYYTIKNEPSFHETADPAVLRVYNTSSYEVKGKLRYSVEDSTVTFTEQPLVSFDANGGAVQCFLPCISLIDSAFTDCWAGKEGGAFNNYFGNGYIAMWADSSMLVDGCRFIRCRAEDRYDPTALQHYGGAINTKVKIVTVENSYVEDCVSTLKEGGALHLGGRDSGSTATITGSTFKNCTAKNGGGAVLASNETLTIENCNFYGCSSSASNGGAVYHYNNSREKEKNDYKSQKTTTITNSVFSADPKDSNESKLYCSAFLNGGAIWTQAETVKLEGCTIEGSSAGGNGGAVYLSKNINISGKQSNGSITSKIENGKTVGSITNCRAVNGSAVYVEDKATFSGNLEVSGNTVSNVNSGAIQTVGAGTLSFEGNVKVENNICSADSDNDHDVLMQIDREYHQLQRHGQRRRNQRAVPDDYKR